jgi:hypothetical protein
MHMSKTLRAAMIGGALATGGAVIGIAGAAAAPASSTPTTSTTPAPAQKPATPSKQPCPNMGSGAKEGSYTGPPPGSGSAAGYAGPGPVPSYQ